MCQFRNTDNGCDLDFDPVFFILKSDLNIMVPYLHTKLRSIGQMVLARTKTHTHTHTHTHKWKNMHWHKTVTSRGR